MSNFMEAAQDMRYSEHAKYEYFDEIFRMAREFAAIKNYVSSNLLNIEEILSILEMQSDLRDESKRDSFIRFLCDVINYYMPKWSPFEGSLASNWYAQMWGSGESINMYSEFVGSLFGLSLTGSPTSERSIEGLGHCKALYSVITFNYDRVLETLCEHVTQFFKGKSILAFRSGQDVLERPFTEVPSLTKLHGDSKAGDIVPPTWSKGATSEALPVWKQAFAVLQDATKLRFIGYSLPPGDLYFKYLLKATLARGQYLKEVDVVCLDPDGSVRKRYSEFFVFPKLRFASEDVIEYLRLIKEARGLTSIGGGKLHYGNNTMRPYQWLEEAHEKFFGNR